MDFESLRQRYADAYYYEAKNKPDHASRENFLNEVYWQAMMSFDLEYVFWKDRPPTYTWLDCKFTQEEFTYLMSLVPDAD